MWTRQHWYLRHWQEDIINRTTLCPGYHIERSVFKLNRTQSNVNRAIKFDVVWSSNKIELTKNKCKSNQIERSIKSDEVRFSSVAERYLSERLTSLNHNTIWIEQNRMFGFPSFDYHGEYKCVNRSSHLKICFLYFHTYQHLPGICYPGCYHGNEFHAFCKLIAATWIKFCHFQRYAPRYIPE